MLVSPIVETCPTKNKEKAISPPHSFTVGTYGSCICIDVYFHLFGIENWKIMACIWNVVSFTNMILFTRFPMYSLTDEGKM